MNRNFCVSSSTKSCFLFSSNRDKILATIFVSFSTYSATVNSAPPVAWAGDVTAPCPQNFSCAQGIADAGVLQREITDGAGNTFIQLIVTGVDAQGTQVTNESYIKMNDPANGISSKYDMAFNDGSTNLTMQAILNTGWANDTGAPAGTAPAIYIRTVLGNTIVTGLARDVTMDSVSHIEIDQDASGNQIGQYIDNSQRIQNSTYITPGAFLSNGVDDMVFTSKQVSGTRTSGSLLGPGSVFLPAVANGMMMGGMGGGMQGGGPFGTGMIGNGAGGTITWNDGDALTMTWFAQTCEGCADPAMMPMGGMMGGGNLDVSISYQTFDNLVDGADPIATAALAQTNPFAWPDPPLGVMEFAAPCLAGACP